MHAPLLQRLPLSMHSAPHAPQLKLLISVSAQLPPQQVRPEQQAGPPDAPRHHTWLEVARGWGWELQQPHVLWGWQQGSSRERCKHLPHISGVQRRARCMRRSGLCLS
jgi:hypothetical protein